ncbi:3-dehydroquinate synthase [Desertibaculum subflavum]|uniref:3-dehydroquinate synthase n=1 Tax=Desertibaculum subflavum TaxID=2268458 RepID=UPI000E662A3B
MTGETVAVALGDRAYDIRVEPGLLGRSGEAVGDLLGRPYLPIVTDETVAQLHLPAVEAGLRAEGIEPAAIVLPPGEGTKSFHHLEQLLDELVTRKIERRDTILALGGGVIGDLVGFAAALLRRGVPFVQAPTTLLAQVDSAVGGKTAINSRHGKNLIGVFNQPRRVLADVAALDTLPRREMLAGYAEVVKYGLLGDATFFGWLEANGERLLAGDRTARIHAVVHSCRMKAAIVARDEREEGDRALLNLGHTFGHALEAETGFGSRLLHGESVAIGCVLAFALSARLGLCPAEDAARVRRHFAAVGLPVAIAPYTNDARMLLEHMRQDKKVVGGRMTFILARGIGQAFITRDVAEAEVLATLEGALAA